MLGPKGLATFGFVRFLLTVCMWLYNIYVISRGNYQFFYKRSYRHEICCLNISEVLDYEFNYNF